MADAADFANDLVQERIDQALRARSTLKPAPIGHSFLFCDGCDDVIPQARRLAQPGCHHCVNCQSVVELKESRHAR